MKIEDRPIGSVRPYPGNPRKNDDAVEVVAASIKEFGWRQPIVVDADGVIVAGHTRYRAALSLGMEAVPVHVAMDLTPDQIRAYRLADNATGEHAEWDYELLPIEMEALRGAEFDMSILGFDEDALARMLADASGVKSGGQCDPDEIPDEPIDPITCRGDIWVLGDHRVMCGDSTVAADVDRLMGGELIDMCFTSPPYNSGDGGYKTDYGGKTKRFYMDNVDDRTEGQWVDFCGLVLRLTAERMRRETSPVVWNVMYTARCRSGYGRSMFSDDHGLSVQETICWDKSMGFPTASKGILSRNWELVFVLSRGEKYDTTQGENEPRWAKWDIPRPVKQHEKHKATFPVDLPLRAIEDFCIGRVIYDPFLGSGTTLIAAEQLGRTCYGMEISPTYCDVIVARWEKFTGRKAERIEAAK